MTEQDDKTKEPETSSIDYEDSQANIDKAKAKAADADKERLAAESE
jgi:hypothetical protein